MIRSITKKDDPLLRVKCVALGKLEPWHLTLAKDMHETMHAMKGVGLAAPQVGVSERIIVVQWQSIKVTMFNPVITNKTGYQNSREGCLSFPKSEWNRLVGRKRDITVRYIDDLGGLVTRDYHGVAAAIIQHEVDHLDGILFTDYTVGRL